MKIQISGRLRTGKTTVAKIIEKSLAEYGIKAKVIDEDYQDGFPKQEMIGSVSRRYSQHPISVEVIPVSRELAV